MAAVKFCGYERVGVGKTIVMFQQVGEAVGREMVCRMAANDIVKDACLHAQFTIEDYAEISCLAARDMMLLSMLCSADQG